MGWLCRTHPESDNSLIRRQRPQTLVDVGRVPLFASTVRANCKVDAVVPRRVAPRRGRGERDRKLRCRQHK